ncbi:MAG: substrate-binding domain-containing protein [Chitinophagaceae bacterium]|nr:substrate-binding domain-containing protein [Chitinophagaceae bacterium]
MTKNWVLHFFNNLPAFLFIVLVIFLQGCKNAAQPDIRDTTTSGTILISVDETFKPVIDSQIKVFESQFPQAKIIVQYKPEAECLRDLNRDSVRMVIVTRGLSEKEEKILTDTLSYKPSFGTIAFDAIAVITNNRSVDTAFTMEDIRSMVKGTSGYKYKVLLDGLSATSTVRYVVDSLLRGAPLSKNIVAAKNSEAVVDNVSNNPDVIGLVGVSWTGNKDDPQQSSFMQKVKIAAIECNGCQGTYVKPYQANIAMARYPMIRPLYYILKENYEGLGSGFKNFLIYEKGQLIFKRAYLLPARMRFEVRDIQISE